MQGRTAVLGLAAVLTLTLTSCGVRSEADRGTETGRLRSSQAEQDMVRNGRTMLEDGSYYAGTDGAVDRVRPEHESEWEKLGRDLRDGWDHLMNGTEEAVDQTGRAAKRAGQGAKDAAEDAGRGLKEAGRDLTGVTCAGSGCSSAFEPAACQGAGGWLKSAPEGRFVQKTRLPARYFSSLSHLAKWGLYEYD